jgi:FkbM family methyltransferase
MPAEMQPARFSNDPSPERRLRIGYVSPDFSSHVVGRNIWPLLHHHDHTQFDITLYANMTHGDPMTEQFQRCADHWCPIATWSDERVAERIRQDAIDILVDLALHTQGNRLLVFARKPAPVQVTFAGYPGTTGLRAIDYRLTDPYLDPSGLNEDYSAEQVYRLPHTFWCFDPQGEEPAVAPLPAIKQGRVTFGCLNNFCKVNDGVLELWTRVLDAVPGSRLMLLSKPGSHRQRTLDFLGRLGIAAERVEFCSPRPRAEYLALYHQIDIGLDTFPYNGHSTSLDSYWMGVPVVTLVGHTVVGRAGLSQLTNLGLTDLVARSPDEFVEIAASLGGDLPRLEALRRGLRERLRQSPLMDAVGFTRGIEQAYRSMWRRWCEQQHQESKTPPPEVSTPEPVFRLTRPDVGRRFSLFTLFDDVPRLKVIDVGASPIDGPPPYQRLFDAGRIELVGFEPDPDQHRALMAQSRPGATYLPHAIGDGSAGVLHICQAPGMTSLLEPDLEVLRHFPGFAQWGTVVRKPPIETKRLDDIAEASRADYLKLDLQGGELAVLHGAPRLLEQVLVIQVEVQFVPFYKGQALFAELDQELRRAGFYFHRFLPIISRVFLPVVLNDRHAGMSQQLWSDAVYVKRFTGFGQLEESSLVKIAVILNDIYGSFDMAALALWHADRKAGTQRAQRYIEALGGSVAGPV